MKTEYDTYLLLVISTAILTFGGTILLLKLKITIDLVVATATIIAVIISSIGIILTGQTQRNNLLLEFIKISNDLDMKILESDKPDKYIQPYLNFFETLSLFWYELNSKQREHFEEMILETGKNENIRNYIKKVRSQYKLQRAYESFEKIYLELGGQKW